MKVRYNQQKRLEPDRDAGVRVIYAPAKRIAFRARWYLILVVVFGPLLVLLWAGIRENVLVIAPGLISLEPKMVVSAGEGFVRKVHVRPGTVTETGKPLFTIESPEIEAAIANLERQLEIMSSDETLEASKATKMENLQRHLEVVNQNRDSQKKLFDRYRRLNEDGLVQAPEIASIQQVYTQSRVSVMQAEYELIAEQAQQQKESMIGDVANARRSINQQLARYRTLKSILAPVAASDSQVVDIFVHEGEWVAKAQKLALLSEYESPVVSAYLEPKHIDYTGTGSSATVTFPNGDSVLASVSEPVVLIDDIPDKLAGPFEGNQPVLKVTLAFQGPIPERMSVEGLPLEVRWHMQGPDVNYLSRIKQAALVLTDRFRTD